jgi:hypothetical protein
VREEIVVPKMTQAMVVQTKMKASARIWRSKCSSPVLAIHGDSLAGRRPEYPH